MRSGSIVSLLSAAVLLVSPLAQAAIVDQDAPIEASAPIKDKWALIIGISKYSNPSLNLNYADKDARDFREFLIKKGNFAPDHIKTLLNEEATRAEILDYMGDKWLPRVAMPNDLVVIYISSHGSPSHADVAGMNFLVAHDTEPEHLFATGISMQELASIIKQRVHSERVVLFLDACHSGAAQTASQADRKGISRQTNFDATDMMQCTGQLVVCSSEPDESSWESKNYQNSVFTRHLMDALSSHGATTTFHSAFDYLKDKVRHEVLQDRGELQTPVLASKWQGGDLMIVAPPTKPRPAPNLQISALPKRTTPQKDLAPDVRSLKELAENRRNSGAFYEATKLYESLRQILESTVGRDTPETTECLTQLGWLYMCQNRLLDAESLQRESVRINETLYGAHSFYVARELTLLCDTLLSEKKFSEAEPIALRAIETWIALGGPDNPNILESYVNLGSIRTHQKKYQEAKELFEHATRLAETADLKPTDAHRIKLETNFNKLRQQM